MSGINAFGTELRRGDGEQSESFVAVAELTSITGPGLTRNTIDVTSHQSEEGWMEFLGGLKDAGQVTAEARYDPSEHDSLVEDFDDENPRTYEMAFPDPDETVWQFEAILTGFNPTAPHDGALGASITFKVTGKPDLSSS